MVKRVLKIILLSLLAVIVIGAAVVCITQWDNIQAAVLGLQHSEEEIDQLKVDAKTSFAEKTGIDLDAVEKMAEYITPEGEIIEPSESAPENPNAEEVTPQTPAEPSSQPSPSTQEPSKPPAKAPGKTDSTTNVVHDSSEVEIILARFYAMQSSYVGQLESIKGNAYAQYRALPKEKRNFNSKISIGRQAVSRATALERTCDRNVSTLLKELRSALDAAGMDSNIANDVEQYYITQKNILKAKYMNKYAKYLS